MMGLMAGMGIWGAVFMLFLWAGLVGLAVVAVRFLFKTASGDKAHEIRQHLDARQVLDQRYVRGEISREQYELIRKDLESSNKNQP